MSTEPEWRRRRWWELTLRGVMMFAGQKKGPPQ
jgi:hypothetical protein